MCLEDAGQISWRAVLYYDTFIGLEFSQPKYCLMHAVMSSICLVGTDNSYVLVNNENNCLFMLVFKENVMFTLREWRLSLTVILREKKYS